MPGGGSTGPCLPPAPGPEGGLREGPGSALRPGQRREERAGRRGTGTIASTAAMPSGWECGGRCSLQGTRHHSDCASPALPLMGCRQLMLGQSKAFQTDTAHPG